MTSIRERGYIGNNNEMITTVTGINCGTDQGLSVLEKYSHKYLERRPNGIESRRIKKSEPNNKEKENANNKRLSDKC